MAMREVMVNVKMERELADRVKQLARADDRSTSAFIRTLLRAVVGEPPKGDAR